MITRVEQAWLSLTDEDKNIIVEFPSIPSKANLKWKTVAVNGDNFSAQLKNDGFLTIIKNNSTGDSTTITFKCMEAIYGIHRSDLYRPIANSVRGSQNLQAQISYGYKY